MTTQVLVGDALAVLRTLPTGSVHCCVTSPPYFGLRDYGTGAWEGGDLTCDHVNETKHQKQCANSQRAGRANVEAQRSETFRSVCGKCGAHRVDQQMGSEPTLDGFIAALVGVFREVRRVLRDDGVFFLNIGDGYARDAGKGQHKPGDGGKSDYIITDGGGKAAGGLRFARTHLLHCDSGDYAGTCKYGDDRCPALLPSDEPELKPKDLMMVPARLAIALQADGWLLRSQMPWVKRSCMPESVIDRPTSAIEYVYMLTKGPRYFYDAETVKVPGAYPAGTKGGKASAARAAEEGVNSRPAEYAVYSGTRNFRNTDLFFTSLTSPHGLVSDTEGEPLALDVNPRGFAGAHFATFPAKLIEPLIRAATSERGCCAACGAPWERVVEKRLVKGPAGCNVGVRDARDDAADRQDQGLNRAKDGHIPGWRRADVTTGWKPTCGCTQDRPLGRPVVLDPFGGAGTTGLVADALGCDAILIELNPDYAAMAQRRIDGAKGALRIEGEAGLFESVAAAE